jgi:hypothetical protein
MELLETASLSYEIERVITESKDYTIIVSPYLKINNRLRPKLNDCFNRNNKNLILFRENSLSKDEKYWLEACKNLTLLPIENLHAKCYINESNALIASMNLYEYSQINNHELGIKLTKSEDESIINQLLSSVFNIIKTDHPDFDFHSLTLPKRTYTMGHLYSELVRTYDFPEKHSGIDSTYEYICQIAIQHHKFNRMDYKEGMLALKRATKIDFETYKLLKREIVKKGRQVK